MVFAAIRSIPLWINAINCASKGNFDNSIEYINRIKAMRKLRAEEIALLALSYLKVDNPGRAKYVIDEHRKTNNNLGKSFPDGTFMSLYIDRLEAISNNEEYESIEIITEKIKSLKGVSSRLSRIFIIR